jgi:hypothetical protein
MRKQNKEELEALFKERDAVRNHIHNMQEMEKNVTDIIAYSHPDINYCVTVYKDSVTNQVNPKLVNKLLNYISAKKDEQFKNDLKKLTVKDKPAVLKILEDIESNKWKISEEVMKKLLEIAK